MAGEMRESAARVLMKDAQWLVPADGRPKGWERYGLSEPPSPSAPSLLDQVIEQGIGKPEIEALDKEKERMMFRSVK